MTSAFAEAVASRSRVQDPFHMSGFLHLEALCINVETHSGELLFSTLIHTNVCKSTEKHFPVHFCIVPALGAPLLRGGVCHMEVLP